MNLSKYNSQLPMLGVLFVLSILALISYLTFTLTQTTQELERAQSNLAFEENRYSTLKLRWTSLLEMYEELNNNTDEDQDSKTAESHEICTIEQLQKQKELDATLLSVNYPVDKTDPFKLYLSDCSYSLEDKVTAILESQSTSPVDASIYSIIDIKDFNDEEYVINYHIYSDKEIIVGVAKYNLFTNSLETIKAFNYAEGMALILLEGNNSVIQDGNTFLFQVVFGGFGCELIDENDTCDWFYKEVERQCASDITGIYRYDNITKKTTQLTVDHGEYCN